MAVHFKIGDGPQWPESCDLVFEKEKKEYIFLENFSVEIVGNGLLTIVDGSSRSRRKKHGGTGLSFSFRL